MLRKNGQKKWLEKNALKNGQKKMLRKTFFKMMEKMLFIILPSFKIKF